MLLLIRTLEKPSVATFSTLLFELGFYFYEIIGTDTHVFQLFYKLIRNRIFKTWREISVQTIFIKNKLSFETLILGGNAVVLPLQRQRSSSAHRKES